MKKNACYWILLYSALLLAGGILGFYRKGSLPSLYMGSAMSLLLALAIPWREKLGLYASLLLSGACIGIFLIRYAKTGALFPSLLLTILSAAMFSYLALCARPSPRYPKEPPMSDKSGTGHRAN